VSEARSTASLDKGNVIRTVSMVGLEESRYGLNRNMRKWTMLFLVIAILVAGVYAYGRGVFGIDSATLLVASSVSEAGLQVHVSFPLDPILGLGYTLEDIQLQDRFGSTLPLDQSYVYYVPTPNRWESADKAALPQHESVRGFTNNLVFLSESEYSATVNLFVTVENEQDIKHWEQGVMPAHLVVDYTSCGFPHRSFLPLSPRPEAE